MLWHILFFLCLILMSNGLVAQALYALFFPAVVVIPLCRGNILSLGREENMPPGVHIGQGGNNKRRMAAL